MPQSVYQAATTHALIPDASLRQALVALRELGQAGISVCAIDSRAQVPAFVSRWCTASAVIPDCADDPDAFLEALLAKCSEHRPRVLIPAHDGTIEVLRRRRAEVERFVAPALAEEPALAIAVDKARTLELAREIGMRTPRGATVAESVDARAALDEVGLPAVVKPSRSWVQSAPNGTPGTAGRRLSATLCATRAEALAAIDEILGEGIEALIQEWLPGDREAISLMYAHGRFWARFAQRADRTSPPLGGYSVMRESIPLPRDIASAAERLIAEMGLEGYAEVEFRRDAQGQAALMEVNPRLSASVEVATHAGVPFARLLYRWAARETLQEVDGYRIGVRMRWLEGDLRWLRNALLMQGHPDVPPRGRAVRTFLVDFSRPTSYDYLDSRDPRPALRAGMEMAHTVRRGVARQLLGPARGSSRARLGTVDTEVALIGAGPYGLSVAAHLSGRGIDHAAFGHTMDTWRRHMPVGMFLKSEGFASSFSDPSGEHTLERFCAEQGIAYGEQGVPVALDTFERYGEWFQRRAAPGLRECVVEHLRRNAQGFELRLSTSETLRARRVVLATGVQGHAYLPPELDGLPPDRVAHSYGQRDPGAWSGARVAVIGAGQSALESAVLLSERGSEVILVARAARIAWNPDPEPGPRPLKARLRHPRSGLGNGMTLRVCSSYPLAVHTAPRRYRLPVAYTTLGPAGGWWLRPRFEGHIETLLERTVTGVETLEDGVRLCLRGPAGEERIEVARVLAGTGYRTDLRRLSFLEPALRASIRTIRGAPVLDRAFQSSVSGLHFVGYPATASFGPVMRFVYGTGFTAQHLARRLA